MIKYSNFFLIVHCILILTVRNVESEMDIGRTTAESIANAHGNAAFNRIEAIRFTFNAENRGEKFAERSWIWEPPKDRVTLISSDPVNKKLNQQSYVRSEVDSSKTPEFADIDAKFINDQYWLLFPLHLTWDKKVDITIEENHPKPLGSGTATKVTVTYPPDNRYSLGDVYELFVRENYLIEQWVYRKGGAEVPKRVNRWKKYTKVGPLFLALERPGRAENVRIYFTNVAVKEKGKGTWTHPVDIPGE